MKILSFDQSSKLSGWAIFNNEKYIDSGVIDKHKNDDIMTRVPEMGLALCEKIKEYKPDLVVMENIQQQSNANTVIHLARLQGCLMLYCVSKKIPYRLLLPSEWRKILQYHQGSKVKREELKEQSINYVKECLGFNFSEDRCEAICINLAAQKLYNTK